MWVTVVVCAVLLSVVLGSSEQYDSEPEQDVESRALRDFYPKDPNLTNEKELVRLFFFLWYMRQWSFRLLLSYNNAYVLIERQLLLFAACLSLIFAKTFFV